MNDTFFIGSAAFISSIIVFVGSVWLLLAMVLGPRLAYLVTASVTLGFTLIMAAVWSYGTPLGPVGELPEWQQEAIGQDSSEIAFGPFGQYPEGEWHVAEEEDDLQGTQAAEIQTAATDYLAERIAEGEFEGIESAEAMTADPESVRLLEQGGTTFGAVILSPTAENEDDQPGGIEAFGDGESVAVVMEWDPGAPSRPARQLAVATLILFAGHLFFLSRSERRALRRKDEEAEKV